MMTHQCHAPSRASSGFWWKTAWLCYVGLVLYLALGPTTNSSTIPQLDKVKHLCAFLVLMLVFPWIVQRGRLLRPLAVALVLGVGIEVAQYLFPQWNRQAELLDLVADLIGTGIGLIFRLRLGRRYA
ncbi:MAG: hypothetical protein KKB70_08420 [Proteobacteria bacterium]|nr:hypothetical protein [Pseudomonadota bacterium]MBU1612198.1 hypothetical protein [Pseudomonadota bacterium]